MITLDGSAPKVVVEEEKAVKINFFDFLNDLTADKKYLFSDMTAREFNTFMVNKGLSNNPDTIMFANEMNKHPLATKEMVYDFYFNIIPKRKPYGKWSKLDNSNKDNIELIMQHYTVRRERAIEYLKILTDSDIEKIKQQYYTGGKK